MTGRGGGGRLAGRDAWRRERWGAKFDVWIEVEKEKENWEVSDEEYDRTALRVKNEREWES